MQWSAYIISSFYGYKHDDSKHNPFKNSRKLFPLDIHVPLDNIFELMHSGDIEIQIFVMKLQLYNDKSILMTLFFYFNLRIKIYCCLIKSVSEKFMVYIFFNLS